MGGSISIVAGLSVFVLHCFKQRKISSELEDVVATNPEEKFPNPGLNEEEKSFNKSEVTKSVEEVPTDLRKRTASST